MKSSYNAKFSLDKYFDKIQNTDPIHYVGSVTAVNGLEIVCKGPSSQIGEICKIKIPSLHSEIIAEVTGLDGNLVKLAPYAETTGIEIGCEVVATGRQLMVPVGNRLLGRMINASGFPCDGKGDLFADTYYPAANKPPLPAERAPNDKRITTGVRSIDSLLTVAKGQRLGIFAGSGVGKSTLMGMIARNTNADINVIGLIGERGREVLDFVNRDLGNEGLKRSVIVVATSDEPSICRLRAAQVCTAIAEYFRDQGKDVMLMMDNLTRFAHAQREIGIANGEPAAQKAYPPSVFAELPKLLERAGNAKKGSITAFYAVLVDGDDFNEPITDKVRGTVDGHIILNRALAQAYHYPAVDVLASISRLSNRVTGAQTKKACGIIRQMMSVYKTQETMILTGNYVRGSSPVIDAAIEMHDAIEEFLKQDEYEECTMQDTLDKLAALSGIDIPESEYVEQPALDRKSTAQIVDERHNAINAASETQE